MLLVQSGLAASGPEVYTKRSISCVTMAIGSTKKPCTEVVDEDKDRQLVSQVSTQWACN